MVLIGCSLACMTLPPRNRNLHRILCRVFALGFALSIVGAVVLLTPTLEFMAVDVVQRLGLPIGVVGNAALFAEVALFFVCGAGLIVMGWQGWIQKRR